MTEFEREFLLERNESVGSDFCRNKEGLFAGEGSSGGEEGEGRAGGKKSEKKYYSVSRKGIALLTALCVILSGTFGFSGALIADNLMGNGSGTSSAGTAAGTGSYSTVNYDLAAATKGELSVQEIIALTANSVVEIRTEQVATDGWMQQYVTSGAGSGVIVTTDGYILTNNHVISGASKITVTLKDGKEHPATLVGTDSQTDLAIIKIDAKGLTAAVYGDSDNLRMGDLTVAIGNPLGELGGTATVGIISALDRQLSIQGKSMTLLQTDASINPGNSGGGLFDQHGQLVGIVVAKSLGSGIEGLGFAIPINSAKKVVTELIDYGYVKGRPSAGLVLMDLTSMQDALTYGVRNLGVYVKSVSGDNAKKAGFQPGDMIYYFGDQKISSFDDVTATLQKHKVGDTIKVTVVRNDQTVDLNLKLAEKTS